MIDAPEARNLEDPTKSIHTQFDGLVQILDHGHSGGSGVKINERSALTIPAVWAAVNAIANGIAALPFRVLRTIDDGHEEAISHSAHALLSIQPNPDTTPFVFIHTLIAHVLTWGNCYARILWDGAGRPRELRILLPWETRPHRRNGVVYYMCNGERFEADEIIHVAGLGFDGLQGISVVQNACGSLGLTKSAETFGGKFFANGATMSGVLEVNRNMTPEVAREYAKQFDQNYLGMSAPVRTAAIPLGTKYTRLGLPPNESQFLETREFQVSEVARWFNIQPHKIGDLSNASFTNIESQNLSFLTDTLMPWIVRFEQEFTRKLLGVQRTLFCDFDEQLLKRGDLAARNVGYQMGIQNGWFSPNDVRADMGKNKITNGDTYLQPLNMEPLGTVRDPNTPPDPQAARSNAITFAQVEPIVRDAVSRMNRKETGIRSSNSDGKLASKLIQHRGHLIEAIRPALMLIGMHNRAEQIATEVMAAHAATFSADASQQIEADMNTLKLVIA